MKVIKEGKKDKWWAGKSGSCFKCGTIVELEESDSPKVESCQREGTWAEIGCPKCGTRIIINK